MTGFSEMPGQDPIMPGGNPERLEGFEADPPPPLHGGGDYPGKGLGIAGFILAIFVNIIGMIVSIVAYSQSKKAGHANGWAVAGIVVGAILFVLGAAFGVLLVATGFALFGTVSNS